MKTAGGLCGITVVVLMLSAGVAFGAPVEVIGDLKIFDDPEAGISGVIFASGLKQTEACYGTITGVAVTAGITGGGNTGIVTLGIDRTVVQSRVTGFCTVIESIQAIYDDGRVLCGIGTGGTVTSVGAGNGLVANPTNPFTSLGTLSVNYGGSGGLYGTSVTVARTDHGHDIYQRKYGKVAVVEPYGNGDYMNPAAAMADLGNWCIPSPANPCLLKIMPGLYDIGSSSVVMQSYVDIEGSGENVTIISGTIDSNVSGVVNGASNAEIRFLTVEHRGAYAYAIGLMNISASPKITNVTVTASGLGSVHGIYNVSSSPTMINVTANASTASGGLSYGVINESSSSPTMINVTANASGSTYNRGVINDYSSPTMINVSASASGGAESFGVQNTFYSSPSMTDVTATASEGTQNYGVTSSFYSSPSMINGTIRAKDGTDNYGVYCNNFASLVMSNVTVTASGGSNTNNYAVYSDLATSLAMSNVTATASGGTKTYGVYSDTSDSTTMSNLAVTASGGSLYNYGIFNEGLSTAKLINVASEARDGSDSFGLLNANSGGNITIDHSTFSGKRSIRNDNSSATIFVGSTKLNGDVLGAAATIKCVGVYSGNYAPISCP